MKSNINIEPPIQTNDFILGVISNRYSGFDLWISFIYTLNILSYIWVLFDSSYYYPHHFFFMTNINGLTFNDRI